MAKLSPMMEQYFAIKKKHQDQILFFRLGDFYEMFADDAKLASHELDLTLTTRDRGKEKSEHPCAVYRITAVKRISSGSSKKAIRLQSANKWRIRL